MAIKLDTIEALRAKIKDAPEIAKEKRNISKQEAIRELKRDIESMQKRGYTLDEIAKFLTDGGLQITTPTLKSYLQRTKADKTKTQKQEKKKHAVLEDAKKEAITPEKVEKEKQIVASNTSQPEPNGSFTVRPDSEI